MTEKQRTADCCKLADLVACHFMATAVTAEDFRSRPREYQNRSIQTTWSISYDHVKQTELIAANLLQLWAYLAQYPRSNLHQLPTASRHVSLLDTVKFFRHFESVFCSLVCHFSYAHVVRCFRDPSPSFFLID